jgi:hypothetical protein
MKAVEKAQRKKAQQQNATLVEISGAETPDKTKED